MTKTKSQVSNPMIKKEEDEEEPKLKILLHGTSNTSNHTNKIRKYKLSKTRVVIQTPVAKVKLEDKDDNKLPSPMPTAKRVRQNITNEQISNLIKYITNDKMNLKAASKKVNMSTTSGQKYYYEYWSDPKRRIPTSKSNSTSKSLKLTQEKINNLIKYLVHDKMNIIRAASKAQMGRKTASKYYKQYLEDPERKIPALNGQTLHSYTFYTQQQIKDLISYIEDDKMGVGLAAAKANINERTARRYYSKYLNDSNRAIPKPQDFTRRVGRKRTNEEVKTVIEYIAEKGMTIREAAAKTNMGESTAGKYYRQYMSDPNRKIPTPDTDPIRSPSKHFDFNQIKRFFTYVIIDKLNIPQASKKANISIRSGYYYYKKYIIYPRKEQSAGGAYSAEKMKKMVQYIQNDKLTVSEAAKKVGMNYSIASKNYKKYCEDPNHEIPKKKIKEYTEEDIKRLIGYIENDKMSIHSAARKMKMARQTASRYYNAHQKDENLNIPLYLPSVYRNKLQRFNQYTEIVADIYKMNPLAKQPQRGSHRVQEQPSIKIKQKYLK